MPGAEESVRSDVRETIREVFGSRSQEHEHLNLWQGAMYIPMRPEEIQAGQENGRLQVCLGF